MKVAHFTGLRKLEIVDLPAPQLNRPDAVLLRIDRVGVCGSDVHYYAEGRIGDQVAQVSGHAGARMRRHGDRGGPAVAGLPPATAWRSIRPSSAARATSAGRAGRTPAATCSSWAVRARPPGRWPSTASCPPPTAFPFPPTCRSTRPRWSSRSRSGCTPCGWRRLRPAATIAILGSGPIGLSVLLCAKATAPCTVYVTDLLDERLAVARRCGADWTGNATHGRRRRHCPPEPRGLDLRVRVFRRPGVHRPGPATARPRRHAGAGRHSAGGPRDLRSAPHAAQGTDVQERPPAAGLRRAGDRAGRPKAGSIPAPLLTHRFPLERIGEAFELVAGYRDGVVKAMLDLSEAK